MNDTDTTQDTLLDRTCSAMVEAMLEADCSATWISQMARLTLGHIAAELIVLEQQAGRQAHESDRSCPMALPGG